MPRIGVIPAVMPKGVEHALGFMALAADQEVIPAVMPKGVEHTLPEVALREACR